MQNSKKKTRNWSQRYFRLLWYYKGRYALSSSKVVTRFLFYHAEFFWSFFLQLQTTGVENDVLQKRVNDLVKHSLSIYARYLLKKICKIISSILHFCNVKIRYPCKELYPLPDNIWCQAYTITHLDNFYFCVSLLYMWWACLVGLKVHDIKNYL